MAAIDTSTRRFLGDPTRRAAQQLSCRLESLPHPPGPPLTVLCMVGELDSCTQLLAENALGAAVDLAPGPLVVDLAGLRFCSAYGLALLATPTGTTGGHAYVLAGLTPSLRRVTGLLWPADRPVRYPRAAAAVAALRSTCG